ncbi:Os11g0329399 [Oryza sativa Japonica Group]|uniref:Os11g0329399 protein n=1 Tax=Oryza sativa subsp. japonica TaxID=39947 RepID=A0A0P0Y1Z5_ORYSJ|nr:Os11g0329399 [Oryza sativa Japonica Group]
MFWRFLNFFNPVKNIAPSCANISINDSSLSKPREIGVVVAGMERYELQLFLALKPCINDLRRELWRLNIMAHTRDTMDRKETYQVEEKHGYFAAETSSKFHLFSS